MFSSVSRLLSDLHIAGLSPPLPSSGNSVIWGHRIVVLPGDLPFLFAVLIAIENASVYVLRPSSSYFAQTYTQPNKFFSTRLQADETWQR